MNLLLHNCLIVKPLDLFLKSYTLPGLGGSPVSVISRAILAGDLSPGRVTQARQVER